MISRPHRTVTACDQANTKRAKNYRERWDSVSGVKFDKVLIFENEVRGGKRSWRGGGSLAAVVAAIVAIILAGHSHGPRHVALLLAHIVWRKLLSRVVLILLLTRKDKHGNGGKTDDDDERT